MLKGRKRTRQTPQIPVVIKRLNEKKKRQKEQKHSRPQAAFAKSFVSLKHDNHIPSRAPQHNDKLTRRRKRREEERRTEL
jgi:hypothetical protein